MARLSVQFVVYLHRVVRPQLHLLGRGLQEIWLESPSSIPQELLTYYSAGSIIRIGPNLLLTSNEDFVRRMTAIRTPYVRNEWFKAIRFDADKEVRYLELGRTLRTEAKTQMLEYTLRDWSCSALRPLTPHVNQWRADPEKHILMRSKVSAGVGLLTSARSWE